MPIAMTNQEKRNFENQGYIVLENFLTKEELERLLAAVDTVAERVRHTSGLDPDEPFAIRNVLSHHETFLNLIDHPKALPLVVDAIGWNIQIRTSHLDYRPPYPEKMRPGRIGRGDGQDQEAGYRNVLWHPDLSGDYLFEGPSLDGRLPFMEIKMFYALSDLTESNSGNLWMIPGSHLFSPQRLREEQPVPNFDKAVELKVPAGTAVLWRTATWHAVGPNLSTKIRKILHIGYHYRWLRPTDYVEQDPELIAHSSPIRRQLLGALPTGSNPLGETPEFHPSSQYWIPNNWDDVPLRAWAKNQSGHNEGLEPL